MNIWKSTVQALALLSRRDRRILAILVLVQVSLAFLDLIAVALIGAVVLVSSSALTGTAPTGIAESIMAYLPTNQDVYGSAIILSVIAGLVMISKSILSYALTRRTFRFLANRQSMISSALASALLSRPLLDVQERSSQNTAATLTRAVNQLTMGVIGGAVIVVSESALLLLLVAALLFVDVTVTVFAVVFFALVGLAVQRVLAHWATSIGERSYEAEVASLTLIQEAVRSYREITVSGRRGGYINQFRGFRWQVAQAEADLRLVNIVTKYIYEIALVVGGGLLAVSQFVTKDSTAAVSVLAIFLAATARILPSVMRLQTAAFSIRSASSESQSAIELHSELQADSSDHQEIALEVAKRAVQGISDGYPGFHAEIIVSGCSLRYPGAATAALEDIELTITEGQSVALVGTTGAGKSTLADVLLGVLEPDSGVVLVAGVPPSRAIERWPGALAYVPQDVTIIEGTIRSNVAMGLELEASDDALVWEALERAHLSSFLREMRDGLNTLVGESGVRLSGGQRQRLGLARALYTRPRLLVLDEATSALDAETERMVADTLEALEGRVTTIIIAHRLATIRNCDQIAYLAAGRLIAIGKFNQVLRAVPDFERQAKLLGLA